MVLSEEEHRRYIFEKVSAAIDTETENFARKHPDLDHDRIKRDLTKVVAPYLRSKESISITSNEQFWAGLQRFMAQAYPGNAPRGEFMAVHELFSRVKKRLGWDQITDFTDAVLKGDDS